MLDDVDKFKEYLNTNSLKQTSERIDIAKAVTLFRDIFTVDELMDKINEEGWPVSKATLYRSLPLLIQSGMIKPIATHQLNNHTFKRCDDIDYVNRVDCATCNKSMPGDDEIIKDINKHLTEKYNIADIINNLLILNGECPHCAAETKRNQIKTNFKNSPSDIRIFLFDDEQLNISYIMSFMKEHSIEVVPFSNPSEFNLDCRCSTEENRVCADIIIADIKMPGMSGIEFIKKQIKKECRIKNIAFISAYWTLEDLDYAGSIGAAIFHKPFSLLDLKRWVDECIQKIQKERILGSEYKKEIAE